jgi:hypothetical protein
MAIASALGERAGARKAGRKLRDVKREASRQINLGFEEIGEFREASRGLLAEFETEDPSAALNQLRGISGALGPEAQADAFEAFQDSPGVDFLRERGLRGVDRRAAAGGGLGTGRRLEALTQFSQGLALQDLQRQLGVLGGVEAREQGLLGQRLRQDELSAADISNRRTGLANVQLSTLAPSLAIAQAKGAATANIVGASISDAATLVSLGVGGIAGLALSQAAGSQQSSTPLSFSAQDPFAGVNIGGQGRPFSFNQQDPFGPVDLGFQ